MVLLLAFGAMFVLALAGVESAKAATSQGAVISNGTVQLGVNDEGDLNYDCVTNADSVCPSPSHSEEDVVGLRYEPLNLDSTSPGCACEGWGIADAGSGLTGYANQSGGNLNITVQNFSSPSPDRAISTVQVSDPGLAGYGLRVTQDYKPSPLTDNLFVNEVTVKNTGTQPVTDLRYRRVMDWDVEPTAFEEWVTNQGDSPQLLFSSDDGFASSDPLAGRTYAESQSVCGPNYVGSCEFTDLGTGGEYPTATAPADHGGLFDFGFGALAPGAERTFAVYYGAAPSEQEALTHSRRGVQVYSMGSRTAPATIATCSNGPAGNSGPEEGKPASFMFGFITTLAYSSITKTDSPGPGAGRR